MTNSLANADETGQTAPNQQATLSDYIRIARPEHMTKHVFIIPGIILAILLRPDAFASAGSSMFGAIVLGFISAVFVASANYVINEWLDREFDKYHPEKSQRAAVQREMSGKIVLIEYIILLVLGLAIGWMVNGLFFVSAVLLAVSGITYNVRPMRTKDVAYLDVLSESINNPLRLLMGWSMVSATSLPPVSLLLAFWFGGAFLMNSKRLAEYRDIVASGEGENLSLYRRSYKYYTENRLSVANLVYALTCSFFMAIFLIKYRIEYVLLFPCIVVMFGVYYRLSLTPDSVARKPEKLFKARSIMISMIVTCAVFVFASVVDIPQIEMLTDQQFIELNFNSAVSDG